jgi:hypothetical protein
MRGFLHCSRVHYAVINASSKRDSLEPVVIAYRSENCLREFIAASSFVGLGFASHKEAMENLKNYASDAASSKQKSRITAMFHPPHENSDLPSGHGSVKHRRVPQSILQFALAAVIAFFYSKNIVSVMIRMALGASF